jgi:hypothetical protein
MYKGQAKNEAINALLGAILEDAQEIVDMVSKAHEVMSSNPGDGVSKNEAIGGLLTVEREIDRLSELKNTILSLHRSH